MWMTRRRSVLGALALGLPTYGSAVARADPVTVAGAASFVGLALLQGAVSYVGGKALASALGDPTISDVHTWIQNAVAELKAFVSAELQLRLDELVLEQMRADLQGTITNLYQYASLDPENRSSNRFLIEAATVSTARLLPLSMNYDQAIFITTTTMAYRLIALQALFELDNDSGHIKSARPMIDGFVSHTGAVRDRIGVQMSPHTRVRVDCGIIGETKFYCSAAVDGQLVVPLMTAPPEICRPQKGCMDSHEVMREVIAEKISHLTVPMQEQTDAFLAAANASINLSIDCYDKMCQKVEDSYKPSQGVPVLMNLAPPFFPDIVVMPGAIVVRPTQ
jgi:hypothetical protein